MIRVLLADDHPVVRRGLGAVLESAPDMRVVGEVGDGEAAIEACARLTPDVLLLDLSLPKLNGIDALKRVKAGPAAPRVLVLSMHAGPEHVWPAARAGADGYVVKGAGLEHLVEAVRAVAAGRTFWGAEAQAVLAATPEADGEATRLATLTAREREVLVLVAQGRSNKEIGAALGISPRTVDVHRGNLMRKLDVHDAHAVTRLASRHGLVRLGD